MPTFNEAVKESGRLSLCALFAANEAVNALLSPIAGDSGGLYPLTSGLRRQLCSDDPANDPTPDVPFPGGQCPGTKYGAFMTGQVPPNAPVNFEAIMFGPVLYNAALPPVPEVTGCNEGSSWKRFSLTGGPGSDTVTWTGCDATFQVTALNPLNGGANNCGDPSPTPPGPPGNIDYGDDITYNIDDSTQITVPINFTFAPAYVALNGNFNIPVKFNVGGVDFDGEVTVSPEFNFDFSPAIGEPGIGTPDNPTGIGQPGGGAEPLPGADEMESTIIGVLVFSTLSLGIEQSSIIFLNGPDIYVPRLASVQFAIKTSDSIGWTADQDVKNLESYIPCPVPQGAIAVRVSPMPGVQSQFTAVRGIPLTTF